MKKYLWLGAAVVAATAIPVSAHAQTSYDDDSGFYVGGNIGGGKFLDSDLTGDMAGSVEGDIDGAGNVVVGYDFGNNWRLELDAGQMWNDLGDLGVNEGTKASARMTTGMVNAIYDFEDYGRFRPFIGAGLGVIDTDLSVIAHNTTLNQNPVCTEAGASACFIRDTDPTIGWQALAGVAMELTDNLSWNNQVKYISAGDLDFIGHSNASADINAQLEGFNALQALTGLTYKFGGRPAAPKPEPAVYTPPPPPPPAPAPVPEPVQTYACWDGIMVTDLANCAAEPAPEPAPAPVVEYVSCWDGSYAATQANCPAVPAPVQEPVYVEPQAFLNNCGPSNIAIFNVPTDKTPKQMSRLGTMPEFGDSHGLSPDQFFEKLSTKYAANENGDRAYLNYLFKSMGYTNGFSDANASMFSEEVLPVGTRGLLGLGKVHHYEYSVLPTNDRDRQAFRIQSANGQVVHFMKTCGNYMYACQ